VTIKSILPCDDIGRKAASATDKYKTLGDSISNQPHQLDTIILGFVLGSKKNDVGTHFQKLLDVGKLSLNEKKEYIYEFHTV
jgi:hypothetical protein